MESTFRDLAALVVLHNLLQVELQTSQGRKNILGTEHCAIMADTCFQIADEMEKARIYVPQEVGA